MTYTEYIDGIPVHPHAAAYPMMSAEELQALADDIKANGQREPIIVTYLDEAMLDEPVVIDGRNRYAACKLAGVEPKFRSAMSLDDQEISPEVIKAWIDSKNLHRRHLSRDQRRAAIERALRANPELPDYQIAKRTRTSPHTVKRVRQDNPDLQSANERVNARGQKRPATYDRAPGFNPGDLDELNNTTAKTPEPAKPRRTPITDDANRIGWEIRKAAEKLAALTEDDRYTTSKEKVTPLVRGHLQYVIETATNVLDDLTTPEE